MTLSYDKKAKQKVFTKKIAMSDVIEGGEVGTAYKVKLTFCVAR